MAIAGVDFIVNRTDLADAEIVPASFPGPGELADGDCLLKVDTFAMTANNITYAVAREDLGYWTFFPHPRDGFGRIPVWGFADVLASAAPGVDVGDRVYGYLPMSSHLLVRPGRVSERSFFDMAEHRQERAPIYNQYAFTRSDPVYRPEDEAVISLFRPLFTTSFLIDDYLRENRCFGATSVVLTSASSKTALGLAYLLAADKSHGASVVGLTSAGNRAFVEGLGCYDQVVSYDEVEAMPVVDTVLVDMAGNADVLARVHHRFGDALKSSTRVGGTHWAGGFTATGPLPGPKPEFFFAPSHAQDRIKRWGGDGFQARVNEQWARLVARLPDWLEVVEGRGQDATMRGYQETLAGAVRPNEGRILSLWD